MTDPAPVLSRGTREALARRHLVMVPILVLLSANAAHQAWEHADLWWWTTLAVLLAALVAAGWMWWREVRRVRAGETPRSTAVPQPAVLLVLLVAATTSWTVVLAKDFGPAGVVAGLVALGATAALARDQRRAGTRYAEELASRGSVTRAPDHQG